MGTVVLYVLLTAVVAAALFALSVWAFGRSEELPPVAPGATLTRLPEGEISGRDVRALRFRMCARGYSMQEVDWALEEAAAEIDRLRTLTGDAGTTGASAEGGVPSEPAATAATTATSGASGRSRPAKSAGSSATGRRSATTRDKR